MDKDAKWRVETARASTGEDGALQCTLIGPTTAEGKQRVDEAGASKELGWRSCDPAMASRCGVEN